MSMMYNNSYTAKKTLLGRMYLANQETGDVIDVNQTTLDILDLIKNYSLSIEALIEKLCEQYDVEPDDIRDDVIDVIRWLKYYNIIY